MLSASLKPGASSHPAQDKLLVTAPEAARLLSISERLLWTWTKQKKIRVLRLGRAVRYAMSALEEFIRQQSV